MQADSPAGTDGTTVPNTHNVAVKAVLLSVIGTVMLGNAIAAL